MKIKHIPIIQIVYALLLIVFGIILTNIPLASGVGYNLDTYQYSDTSFYLLDIFLGGTSVLGFTLATLCLLIFTIIGLVKKSDEGYEVYLVTGFIMSMVFHILVAITISMSIFLLTGWDITIDSIDRILIGYYLIFVPIIIDVILFVIFRRVYHNELN